MRRVVHKVVDFVGLGGSGGGGGRKIAWLFARWAVGGGEGDGGGCGFGHGE